MKYVLVMIGGFLGAISRFVLSEWIQIHNGFPLGTLLINLIGCFFLGWFLTFVSQKGKLKYGLTLFVGTGFTGSFTTFSALSVETLLLFREGLIVMGMLYVLTSIVLGLVLVFLGHKMALSKK